MELKTYCDEKIEYIVVEPNGFDAQQPYPAIILLHGYGSNMHDLAGLTPAISRDEYIYICPNAPLNIELAPGYTGYAWLELESTDFSDSREILTTMIKNVKTRYNFYGDKMLLGGFSQGAMLSLDLGIQRPDLFAGLMALSGCTRNESYLKSVVPTERSQSIFIAHGTQDTMIPISESRAARDFLISENYSPTYYEYVMGHEINQELIADLIPWIKNVLLDG